MKKIYYLVLLIIFLTGTFIRLFPVTEFDKPLKYDSYYHLRVVELIKDTGTVPLFEPWPYEGRPHIYPPLYHLMLIFLSAVASISLLDAIRFFLPIISSLTILATFWLVKSFSTKNAALFASLFMALNPYLISGSYDSPQVINLLLSLFAVYFLLKDKYLHCGLILAPIYLVNTFSALVISLPILVYMLLAKRLKESLIVFIPPVIASLLWYLPRAGLLYCADNSIGTSFIGKTISGLLVQQAALIIIPLLVIFALVKRINGNLYKFYLLWTLISTALLLSFVLTFAFHPWRQSIYLSFGFSIFAALVLDNLNRLKKLIFLALFIIIFLSSLSFFINNPGLELAPPLSTQEYMMIGWAGQNLPDNSIPLANHDVCAALLTLTNKTCALDISFECIQNKTAWYDYENFFWLENSSEIRGFFRMHPITHILYRPSQFNEKAIEQADVDKIYSSWSCKDEECDRAAIIYKILAA
jgi:asparagine N-glycosylation enzyme membrane subunit Stt3